jgi:hypothetical protein
MLHLDLAVEDNRVRVAFDVPDKPGEQLPLADLALFGMYLDVIRAQVTELATRAVYKVDGYDLIIDETAA